MTSSLLEPDAWKKGNSDVVTNDQTVVLFGVLIGGVACVYDDFSELGRVGGCATTHCLKVS